MNGHNQDLFGERQNNGERDSFAFVSKRDSSKYVTLTLTRSLAIHIPLPLANTVLSILEVLTRVGLTTSLVVYTTSLSKHRACGTAQVITGPNFVLFFTSYWFTIVYFLCVLVGKLFNPSFPLRLSCSQKQVALMGLLNAVNGLLIVYSSTTDRTPAFLQSILSSSVIPFTVVLRPLVLRKSVSGSRLVCAFAVLVGLIICMEPSLFGLGNSSGSSKNRTATTLYWPIVFCAGFIPLALMNVLGERQVKKNNKNPAQTIENLNEEVYSVVFLAWLHLYNFVFLAALFWTTFIPQFGIDNSWADFSNHMVSGYHCHFGQGPLYNCSTLTEGRFLDRGADPYCHIPITRCWIFIFFYCFGNLVSIMLIKYAEGALYLVIINAASTPLSTLVNTLFTLDKESADFLWRPSVDVNIYYRLAGTALIIPAVVAYVYISRRENKQSREETVTSNSFLH